MRRTRGGAVGPRRLHLLQAAFICQARGQVNCSGSFISWHSLCLRVQSKWVWVAHEEMKPSCPTTTTFKSCAESRHSFWLSSLSASTLNQTLEPFPHVVFFLANTTVSVHGFQRPQHHNNHNFPALLVPIVASVQRHFGSVNHWKLNAERTWMVTTFTVSNPNGCGRWELKVGIFIGSCSLSCRVLRPSFHSPTCHRNNKFCEQ